MFLYYATIFLVIAVIAAVFGSTAVADGAASMAKILLVLFLLFAAVGLLINLVRRPR